MTPSRHSLVHGIGIAVGAILGLIVGYTIGVIFDSILSGNREWLGALGAGIGIITGIWGLGFLLRRFIIVNCPRCGARMSVRMFTHDADLSFTNYKCTNCAASINPGLERWTDRSEHSRSSADRQDHGVSQSHDEH